MGVLGPRIDKVTMAVRAPAGTAISGLTSVKLNAGGSVIPSAAADAIGVCCPGGTILAGYPIAILMYGEIVDFGGSIATTYYAGAGGTIGTAAAGGAIKVGTTIEGGRLVVAM